MATIPSFLANGFGFNTPRGSTTIPVNPDAQFRPQQWAKPAMVMLTVPAGSGNVADTTQTAATPTGFGSELTLRNVQNGPTSYVFDAVLALEHDQSITKTQHPVQTSASISSHAYINPAQLVMYVLMSDVAAQFAPSSQLTAPYVQKWTGSPSKSVSAYKTMLDIQAQRLPLTITTRLRTYYNMLVMRVSPREDDKTVTGARFRIEFEQLFIANTQVSGPSTRPNDTDDTNTGAVNVQPPSAATAQQFSASDVESNTTTSKVIGAGTWSSRVGQLFSGPLSMGVR